MLLAELEDRLEEIWAETRSTLASADVELDVDEKVDDPDEAEVD